LQAQRPAVITIGTALFHCAAELGPVEFLPTDGGSARGQRLTAHILKSKLAASPKQKTIVTHNGVSFKVVETGGQNATDVSWIVRCVRWID